MNFVREVSRGERKSRELVNGSIKTLLWMLLACLIASVLLVDYITKADILSTLVTAFVYYPFIAIVPIAIYFKVKPVEKPMTFLRLDKKIDKKIALRVVLLGIFISTTVLSLMFLFLEAFDYGLSDSTNFLGSIVPLANISSYDYFSLIFQFVLIYILSAGIYEEIFFRGFLLNGLRPLGQRKAVVLSSIAFGLYHFNPVRGIITFAISMIWGKIVYVLKNTKYSILLHIAYNSVITIFFMYVLFAQYNTFYITLDTNILIAIEAVSAVISITLVRYLLKKIYSLAEDIEKKDGVIDSESVNTKYQEDHVPLVLCEEDQKKRTGLLEDDYIDPVKIKMSFGAMMSYAFYVLITLSLTMFALMSI